MVAFLSFANGEPFATGAADYTYAPATEQERLPRFILRIEIEDIRVAAVMDTGSPYVVCSPKVARQIPLSPEASLGMLRLLICGIAIDGHLYRLRVRFLAVFGEPLDIEATVFVLDLEWEEAWGTLPAFVGLSGCLERMRFAIDPSSDMFYFGAIP